MFAAVSSKKFGIWHVGKQSKCIDMMLWSDYSGAPIRATRWGAQCVSVQFVAKRDQRIVVMNYHVCSNYSYTSQQPGAERKKKWWMLYIKTKITLAGTLYSPNTGSCRPTARKQKVNIKHRKDFSLCWQFYKYSRSTQMWSPVHHVYICKMKRKLWIFLRFGIPLLLSCNPYLAKFQFCDLSGHF